MTGSKTIKCVHCLEKVETTTISGYGTVWIHADGYRECPPRFAAPNL